MSEQEPAGLQASLGTLGATLGGMLGELRGMFADRVELLSLELQRAGLALVHIAFLGLALTVLGLTGWFLLWGLLIAALVLAAELHWVLALLLALAVHALLAGWVVYRIKHLLPTLSLPATRRRLVFEPLPQEEDDESPREDTPAAARPGL